MTLGMFFSDTVIIWDEEDPLLMVRTGLLILDAENAGARVP